MNKETDPLSGGSLFLEMKALSKVGGKHRWHSKREEKTFRGLPQAILTKSLEFEASFGSRRYSNRWPLLTWSSGIQWCALHSFLSLLEFQNHLSREKLTLDKGEVGVSNSLLIMHSFYPEVELFIGSKWMSDSHNHNVIAIWILPQLPKQVELVLLLFCSEFTCKPPPSAFAQKEKKWNWKDLLESFREGKTYKETLASGLYHWSSQPLLTKGVWCWECFRCCCSLGMKWAVPFPFDHLPLLSVCINVPRFSQSIFFKVDLWSGFQPSRDIFLKLLFSPPFTFCSAYFCIVNL